MPHDDPAAARGPTQPPYTNRGVQIPTPPIFPPSAGAQASAPDAEGVAFFDWYQATIDATPQAVQASFLETFGGEFEETGGRNTYAHGSKHSALSFTINWGGHNPHPNITATSGDSPAIAQWARDAFPSHRVSRADVAFDFSFPRSFDTIRSIIEPLARERGVSIALLGDPAENDPDYPEDKRRGRTLYLGSPKSDMRLRLYEKGFERRGAGVEHIDPNLSRLEVVARPKKAHKALAATLSPFAIVGLSKWIAGAVAAVVGDHPAIIPANIKRDTTTDERLAHLARQYGRTLREVIDEVGWGRFVETMSIILYDYGHPKRLTPAIKETIQ